MTTIRGFKLNNCKKCGAVAGVISDARTAIINRAREQFASLVYIGCTDSDCVSPYAGAPTLVRAGRLWNMEN